MNTSIYKTIWPYILYCTDTNFLMYLLSKQTNKLIDNFKNVYKTSSVIIKLV